MAQDLIVVSSFPEKKLTHGTQTVGVASYTKTLLQALVTEWSDVIQVYAEILIQPSSYQDGGVQVRRLWRRNHLRSLLTLAWQVGRSPIKLVLVSFEIHMFGGVLANLLMMSALLWWKVVGKRVTLILHQAPQRLDELEGNWWLAQLKNMLLRLWYAYLRVATHHIVVFEAYLQRGVGREAVFIPHFIQPVAPSLTQVAARKRLQLAENKKYAMVFGYLAPYKGITWLLENWPIDTDYELLVVGGINPNHVNNPAMQNYVQRVQMLAKQKKIQVTGVVTEAEMDLYFTSCDVVLLPYLTMFSSSGPLALALSYQKPVLLSAQLASYFESEDAAQSLIQAGLAVDDLIFDHKSDDLVLALQKLTQEKIAKMKMFARAMQVARDPSVVAQQYSQLLQQK